MSVLDNRSYIHKSDPLGYIAHPITDNHKAQTRGGGGGSEEDILRAHLERNCLINKDKMAENFELTCLVKFSRAKNRIKVYFDIWKETVEDLKYFVRFLLK